MRILLHAMPLHKFCPQSNPYCAIQLPQKISMSTSMRLTSMHSSHDCQRNFYAINCIVKQADPRLLVHVVSEFGICLSSEPSHSVQNSVVSNVMWHMRTTISFYLDSCAIVTMHRYNVHNCSKLADEPKCCHLIEIISAKVITMSLFTQG